MGLQRRTPRTCVVLASVAAVAALLGTGPHVERQSEPRESPGASVRVVCTEALICPPGLAHRGLGESSGGSFGTEDRSASGVTPAPNSVSTGNVTPGNSNRRVGADYSCHSCPAPARQATATPGSVPESTPSPTEATTKPSRYLTCSLAMLGVLVGATSCTGGGDTPDTLNVRPWAVAPSHGSVWSPDEWAPTVSAVGVEAVRGFADQSERYTTLLDAGLTPSGVLWWAPEGEPFAFPVSDLDGWRTYVEQQVSTYPDVDHWEIWNEPPNFTADDNPAHYAEIVRVAYDAAKSVNSDVQIGLAAKSTHIRWLAEAIEAGAAGHFDYVTLHPYERAGLVAQGGEVGFMGITPTVRAMLAEVAPAQSSVPIRFTEVGVPVSVEGREFEWTTFSPQVQADQLVKIYTMGIAQGVEQIAWYDPWDGDYRSGPSEPPFGLIARDGTPRPALTALTTMIGELGQRPDYVGWTMPDPSTYVFVFTRMTSDGAALDGAVLVAWSASASQLDFNGQVTVTEPATGQQENASSVQLSESPSIIHVGREAGAQAWLGAASSSRDQPFGLATTSQFPGGGESATVSAVGGARGLTLLNAPDVRQVDGRAAFVMSDRAEASFIVNPAFSTWETTSVTITAQVKSLEGNPGFALRYDAAGKIADLNWSGQRSAGSWRSVPGSEWTTMTWTVDDAAFVGMYGVNLRLDSDSTQHSGYALAELTITKD